MNAEDFLKTIKIKPALALKDYWDDLYVLKNAGCTLSQMTDFLKKNGVEISPQGLSQAIKRREEKASKAPDHALFVDDKNAGKILEQKK